MESARSHISPILFPHSHVPEGGLAQIRVLFGSLILCLPWFMEDPPLPEDSASLVSLRRPPEALKPGPHFKSLLSEYRLWIRHNQDNGYAASLRALQNDPPSEETPWEIRRMIRRMGEEKNESSHTEGLKWHLILHLAGEMEENQLQVEEGLSVVRRQESPLAEAMGEEAPLNTSFSDLPPTEGGVFQDRHLLLQVFEAWFGLFGDYLDPDSVLVTWDRQVIECILELIEKQGLSAPALEEETLSAGTSHSLVRLPQFTREAYRGGDSWLKAFSNRCLVLI